MNKIITELRILVCGYSQDFYPRDETIMSGLRQLPFKQLIDLRIRDGSWVKRRSGQKVTINLKRRAKRRLCFNRLKIKALIITGKVDLILAMIRNEDLALNICRWAQRYGIPVIYDLFTSRYLAAQNKQEELDFWRACEQKIVSLCSHCLTFTLPYKKFYEQTYGLSPERISVVPLAVEDIWLDYPGQEKKQNQDTFIVAYWGNAHKHHGLDLAFEAAYLLRDLSIQFYFYGSIKLKEIIEKAIETKHLTNVSYRGFLPTTESLVEAVDKADLCFGHLALELDAHLALPNKALQGMARGKTVLHVDSPQLRNHYAGSDQEVAPLYFFSGGASGLAEAIRQLYHNPGLRVRIGRAARECVRQNHSVDQVRTAVEEVICKAQKKDITLHIKNSRLNI